MNPYLGEFLGTLLLILLGEGVVAGVVLKGTKAENAGWLTVCIAWGLAVTLGIYAVGEFTGAHLNPAITIAFAVIGEFDWNLVAGYCLAQVGGAFCGAVLLSLPGVTVESGPPRALVGDRNALERLAQWV